VPTQNVRKVQRLTPVFVDVRDQQGMRRGLAGGLFLLAVATLLTPPLAAAMPPDQTWIAGIYDAADLDDLVTLIANLCAPGNGHSHEVSPLLGWPEEPVSLDLSEYESVGSSVSARGPPHVWSTDVIFASNARHPSIRLRGPVEPNHSMYQLQKTETARVGRP
jgi:hypothetical protein